MRRASDAFLALPPGPERDRRAAAGIEATLAAARQQLALELAVEARGRSPSPAVVTLHLRALARLGHLPEFVATARADTATQRAAVDAALLAEHGALLALADAALRAGATPVGRYVFERLAAVEPADPGRLADFALACRHLGELDTAERTYATALQLAPADALLVNDHGLFLRATGRREAATAAFWRSFELDAGVAGGRPGDGPAITNLLHAEALQPGSVQPDPLPRAANALARRPEAAMLRRLVLDTALDRLDAARAGAVAPAVASGGANR
ncbi:MAG: hypothetical protein KF830_13170 [Planctomycetes bacterium]|nr:hypothetical protein [Planctomycetota bacterium]